MKQKQSYKNLIIWQKAHELVLIVYQISKHFPAEERYGLTSQLRRAVLSVALNIIEGYARRSNGDFRRFLDIALASLSETEYLLELSHELGYLPEVQFRNAEALREECGRVLWSYRGKVR